MSEYRDLVDAVREFSEERGWTPVQTPKNLAMAICGEAGELAAELQWVESSESVDLLAADPELRRR
ncbi:MAG: nucleotide pyrophosphohydrolase, partial [Salana multivorans]|nr:nucleotide pyrophosphohydrolase [Salana multivorans]